jgi:BCD family chlorophyll transporter-like MFS transporter
MMRAEVGRGLALGAWGAAQATAAGLAILLAGALRDGIGGLALRGTFGEALATPAFGYSFVYHLEILLLFVTLLVLAPLVRIGDGHLDRQTRGARLGIADLPT